MKKTGLVLTVVFGLFVLLTVTAGISYAMSQADEALIRKIDGRRYTFIELLPGGEKSVGVYDVRGNVFVYGIIRNGNYSEVERAGIQGRETRVQIQNPVRVVGFGWVMYATYTISEDGYTITRRKYWSEGLVETVVYFWQE